jgi:hypothetical protein
MCIPPFYILHFQRRRNRPGLPGVMECVDKRSEEGLRLQASGSRFQMKTQSLESDNGGANILVCRDSPSSTHPGRGLGKRVLRVEGQGPSKPRFSNRGDSHSSASPGLQSGRFGHARTEKCFRFISHLACRRHGLPVPD